MLGGEKPACKRMRAAFADLIACREREPREQLCDMPVRSRDVRLKTCERAVIRELSNTLWNAFL